jgi:hypothetical protein
LVVQIVVNVVGFSYERVVEVTRSHEVVLPCQCGMEVVYVFVWHGVETVIIVMGGQVVVLDAVVSF